MAIYSNLTIDQGSAFTATVTIEDSSGNPKNVNGYALAGKIKKEIMNLLLR